MNRLKGFLWLIAAFLFVGISGTLSQTSSGTLIEKGTVEEIRTLFPSEWGVPHPTGLSYSLDLDYLFLLEKHNFDQEPAKAITVTVITPIEDWVSTVSLEFPLENRINVTYDDGSDRLLLLNNELAELAQIEVGIDGILDPATLARVGIAHLGLGDAQGMDVDFEAGRLFILDSTALQVVIANLDANFGLVSRVDISHLDAPDLRGIAVHPGTHNLFVVSPTKHLLFELTQSGQLVNSYDLESLHLNDPRGLDFGPSADSTDPPDTVHLFIADSQSETPIYLPLIMIKNGGGVDVSSDIRDPAQTLAAPKFGRIIEAALKPAQTPTLTPTPINGAVRFAVIGDFGNNSLNEARVATLVADWNPDFVITTGDNNYPDGEAATIDENIGQYYREFIGNYQGSYGPGSPNNRFWPSLGNHDWHTITCAGDNCTGAYFDYFTLPNNERYYEVDLGLIHLFALDSDSGEPDGRDENSIQAGWLQNQLATSTSCYNIVSLHHAPYSSGKHGSNATTQWPFSDWGADAVLSGHDHLYERLDVNGTPYIVNGAGGAGLYSFDNLGTLPPEAISVVRYNQDHGAMLVTAASTGVTYQFYNADGILIDDYYAPQNCAGNNPDPTPSSTPTPAATPAPTGTPMNPATPTPTGTPTALIEELFRGASSIPNRIYLFI
ncbi:MAG TPA: metallophosphoesterase [Anaerolineales bacterium]|nr:metallophosphoesterase [Anaerolineales bacterium]